MHTNNSRKRKNKTIERSILPVGILLVTVLLIVLVITLIITSRINNYYDSSRLENMLESEESAAHLDGFAFDLAVVGPSTQVDDSFDSHSAVSVKQGSRDLVFAKNPFERMHPASTTKIMTALLAFKYGNLSDMVTVTTDAVITEPGASLAHINPGDKLSLEQLIYGMMLPSGNDAANAVAVHIAGSIDGFCDLMNEEALRIGATGTHFTNANGITDEKHYSTAYDLYLIMQEALKYEEFRTVTSASSYNVDFQVSDGTYKSQSWKNSNKYIQGTYKAPDGVKVISGKTGTTLAALSCLVEAARISEKSFINVILKAPNRDTVYENMNELFIIDGQYANQ